MKMQILLEKTKKMNELLRNAAAEVDFQAIAGVVGDSLQCNICILDKDGHIMGYYLSPSFSCPVLENEVLSNNKLPSSYNDALLAYVDTSPNIVRKETKCAFREDLDCAYSDMAITIVPVVAGGERLGTLLLGRMSTELKTSDLILVEHAATVAAMEMIRYKQEALAEEARQQAAVQVALGTLSFSELNAMKHIFEELGGPEGRLVASKVADRVGITRSVIVNALRKFESAGVIETKSLGMKGTYIKVLNEKLLDELNKLR